jgi:leucyl aminopeptidase
MLQFIDSSTAATRVEFISTSQIANHPLSEIFHLISFEGKYGQIEFLPEQNCFLIGITKEVKFKNIDPYNQINPYSLGARLGHKLKPTKVTHLSFETFPNGDNQNSFIESFLLGLSQSLWEFDVYKTKKSSHTDIDISLSENITKVFDFSNISRFFAFDNGITLTRWLVDQTPEVIHPGSIKGIIEKELGKSKNITIESFSYEKLLEMGMNGITMVGRGSRYKPTLIHTILSAQKPAKTKIVLVGKGLTYDSGGLDIKTGGFMQHMKSDMAGSATMFGVIKTLAELGGLEDVEVHWVSAFCENMVSPESYKSDDIITTYSGQTVEIRNTDAEGRLTLADTLSYATKIDPDFIIDAATLTGACVRSVSEYYTSIMGNDADLIEKVRISFESTQEMAVHTPLPEVLRDWVKGDLADLNNTATEERQAGHLTAGLFLSHFVDQNLFCAPLFENMSEKKQYPWVHLDIAGSAHNNKRNDLATKGATGHGVRSLVNLLLSL